MSFNQPCKATRRRRLQAATPQGNAPRDQSYRGITAGIGYIMFLEYSKRCMMLHRLHQKAINPMSSFALCGTVYLKSSSVSTKSTSHSFLLHMVNECEIQSDNRQQKSFFIVLAEAPSFVVMRLSFRSRTRSPQRCKHPSLQAPSLRLERQVQTTTSNGRQDNLACCLPRWSEIHWARSCSLVRLGNLLM